MNIWTSTFRRTIQTARHVPYPIQSLRALDEIDAGICDSMTYEEIREKMPHTELGDFEKDPDINKLADLFTVNAIVNYVDGKLNAA